MPGKFWLPMSLVLAAGVAGLATTGNAAAQSGLAVKGDPKAWKEIEAALTSFSKVKTYRAKQTVAQGVSMALEAVNPDRYHTKMTMAGFAMETIQVGREVRTRQGKGPWMCTGLPADTPETNPTKMTGEVTASRGPAERIDGVSTQSYTYSWKSRKLTARFRIFIAGNNGLPKRMQMLNEQGAAQMTFDYFDYNAPVTITLPPCS